MKFEFKSWVLMEMAFAEMAFMSKAPLTTDENDIEYLYNFPPMYWMQALQYRYGTGLVSALDSRGNLKPNWSDIQEVQMKSNTNPVFKVNTRISTLVKKLKSLGYELKNPEIKSNTTMYYTPMSRFVANDIVSTLRKASTGTVEKNFESVDGRKWKIEVPVIQPGIGRWSPNSREHGRNDYDEPVEMDNGLKIWNSIKDDVYKQAEDVWDKDMIKAKSPMHPLHINSLFWDRPSKKKEFIDKAVSKVWMNLKNPNMLLPARRRGYIQTYFYSILQNGHMGKRVIDRMRKNGQDPNKLLYSIDHETGRNHTIDKIKDMADVNPKLQGRYRSILSRRQVA